MIQQLILKPSGYVDAVPTDKSRLVTDDATVIGTLLDYNNTTYTWVINSPLTIVANSVVTTLGGTGHGVAFSDSTVLLNYCLKDAVKDRLLILTTNTSYDTALDTAIDEASRTIDIFLKPYVTVPLTIVDDQIAIVAADLSSSIFKRRLIPQEVKLRGTLQPDMINDVDGTGWFAVGLKKLLDYIKSYYALAQVPVTSGVMLNPEVYMELFKNGTLTLKEARAYMADTTSTIEKKFNEISTLAKTETLIKTVTDTENITVVKDTTDGLTKVDDITRTEDLSKVSEVTEVDTKTLTKTVTETDTKISDLTKMEDSSKIDVVDEYKTKRQKSFSFIEGDPNTYDTYKEQDDS